MKNTDRKKSLALCVLSAFLIAGSSVPVYAEPEITSHEDNVPGTVTSITADGIAISGSNVIYLSPGEKKYLEYTLSPSDADELPKFSASYVDEACFTVDENGMVTASSSVTGYGYVTATIQNGSEATYTILVAQDPEGFDFDQNAYYIPAGVSMDISDYILIWPAAAKYTRLNFTSGNEDLFTVYREGHSIRLYAKKPGAARLVISTDNGFWKAVVVNVTDGYSNNINGAFGIQSLKLGETKNLNCAYSNSTGDYSKESGFEYQIVYGKDVISVSNSGEVTAIGYGRAQILVTTRLYDSDFRNGGHSRKYSFYVAQDPKSLTFAQSDYYIEAGSSGQFYAFADCEESEYCLRTFSSDNTSVIRVTTDAYNYGEVGQYSALQEGTAHITCKASNGVSTTATVHVVAKKDSSDCYISYESGPLVLNEGESFDLKNCIHRKSGAEVTASDLSNLSWKSLDPDVAAVKNGIVSALKKGMTRIELYDQKTGLNLSSLELVVSQPAAAIEFINDTYYLMTGDEMDLRKQLRVTPSDCVVEDIIFVSGNTDAGLVLNSGGLWSIYGNEEGYARITAMTADGKTAHTNVYIESKKAADSIVRESAAPLFLHVGYMIKADVIIQDCFNDQDKYELTSKDPSVAAVRYDDLYGLGPMIEGISAGTATITARLKENPDQYISFPVVVSEGDIDTYQYAYSMYQLDGTSDRYYTYAGNQDEYTVYTGNCYQLNVDGCWNMENDREYPAAAPVRNILDYTDADSCIARFTLNQEESDYRSGLYEYNSSLAFCALRPGTVTVHTIGNRTVTIHVKEKESDIKVTGITLNTHDTKLAADGTLQLTAAITPSNATNQNVKWTVNNSIATVDSNGRVTMGRSYGTAVITATTEDGSYSDSCTIQMLFKDVTDTGKYYYNPVYWAAEKAITKGYPAEGTFKPQANCTREAVVTFLWRLAGQPEPKSTVSKFSDVQNSSKYYYKAVLWAAEQGITNGYADGTFKPSATCLREHVVTFLWRYAGKPNVSAVNTFTDVTTNDYYYMPVLWAAQNSITKGYADDNYKTFRPKNDCLREHVVTFLYRYATVK